jgi:hypothetical protein
VLTVEREVAMPGGAGNVVRNLTALGAAVAFLSVVGDDQAGSDLTGLIGGQPGVEPWLLVQGGRATTTKSRFIASGQQMLRTDHEVARAIHPRLADRLVRIAQDTVAATKVMVLSDYRKGVLAGDVPARLIAAARAAGRRVIVDPKGDDYSVYAGADLITPNRNELREATGHAYSLRHHTLRLVLSFFPYLLLSLPLLFCILIVFPPYPPQPLSFSLLFSTRFCVTSRISLPYLSFLFPLFSSSIICFLTLLSYSHPHSSVYYICDYSTVLPPHFLSLSHSSFLL